MVQTVQELDKAEAKLSDLKDLKYILKVEDQLKNPQVKKKIEELRKHIEEECCSEEPNALWHRKQHIVQLSYKEGYTGKTCKSRAIPMNKEYKDICEKEIKQLLVMAIGLCRTLFYRCFVARFYEERIVQGNYRLPE